MTPRTTNRVTRSLIVRVIEGRGARRIVVHDLRSRQVREFATWEDALAYARSLTEVRGLR
jgi:hypothetical protein